MGEFANPHYRTFVPANRAERRAAKRGKTLEPNAVKARGKHGFRIMKKWPSKPDEGGE